MSSETDGQDREQRRIEEAERLLAGAPIIRNACDLDLMAFLHRHPRILLTSEQLAGFVGYNPREIARVLDAFIEAGLLAWTTQRSRHAARMFVLLLDGPQGAGVRARLELDSTRAGRQNLLDEARLTFARAGRVCTVDAPLDEIEGEDLMSGLREAPTVA